MKPTGVLDARIDLLTRASSGLYRQAITAQCELDLGGFYGVSNRRDVAEKMVDGLCSGLRYGEQFYIEPDTCTLIEHAAGLLDETDTFHSDLAPARAGIAYFARGLPMRDIRGKTLIIHWAIWNPVVTVTASDGRQQHALQVWYFNDFDTEPDDVARDPLNEIAQKAFGGRWGCIGAEFYHNGTEVGAPLRDISASTYERLRSEGARAYSSTNLMRYFHAFAMLAGQPVTERTDVYVPKTVQRRARHQGLPPAVTCVRLRSAHTRRSEGESHVEWSHRWVVRGHPRWQPYGPRGVDHEHDLSPVEVVDGQSVRHCTVQGCAHKVARIWIAPYVKGPQDAELRVTEHVYMV